MIIDKNQVPNIETDIVDYSYRPTQEAVSHTSNALCEVFNAVKDILKTLKEDQSNPNSRQLFETIALNTGQLNRIRSNKENREIGIALPAVFMHFINVRYLVAQSRIGEGRATMRIQYVLDRLNSHDDSVELEGYQIFQRINIAISDLKNNYPALRQRFNLTYFDQPESFSNGVQSFWIDYEVWFTEYSTDKFRDYVTRYLVIPPFTDHEDQQEDIRPLDHGSHDTPTYDDVSGLE